MLRTCKYAKTCKYANKKLVSMEWKTNIKELKINEEQTKVMVSGK